MNSGLFTLHEFGNSRKTSIIIRCPLYRRSIITGGGNCSPGSSRLYRLGFSHKKPRCREMSGRGYALHSVCPQFSFSFHPLRPPTRDKLPTPCVSGSRRQTGSRPTHLGNRHYFRTACTQTSPLRPGGRDASFIDI